MNCNSLQFLKNCVNRSSPSYRDASSAALFFCRAKTRDMDPQVPPPPPPRAFWVFLDKVMVEPRDFGAEEAAPPCIKPVGGPELKRKGTCDEIEIQMCSGEEGLEIDWLPSHDRAFLVFGQQRCCVDNSNLRRGQPKEYKGWTSRR